MKKSTHTKPGIATKEYSFLDRATGMMAGVAVGDALGMPVEFLTPERIQAWYGPIKDLVAVHSDHPHHQLPLGSVTDDTDHTLLLAKLLIDQGEILPTELAKRLLAWSRTARVQENQFVGPSTLKSLAAMEAGEALEDVPRAGNSVGAAMRMAPLAIVFADRKKLIEQVVASCAVSHYTHNAISGAMAMAFALSESLKPQADLASLSEAAKQGAIIGRDYGDWSWAQPIERRINYVMAWVKTLSEEEVLENLYALIGVDLYPEQLVPSAIAIVYLAKGNPQRAILLAANLGGDTDTLASMVGALCGGLRGVQAINQAWLNSIETANQLDLRGVGEDLVSLRAELQGQG